MTRTDLATSLHHRLGRPVRGLGICYALMPELEDVLTRAIDQAQRMPAEEFRALPADLLARQLLREVAKPGVARDAAICEVW